MTSTINNQPFKSNRGRKAANVIAEQMGVCSQQDMIWQQVRQLKQFTMASLHQAIVKHSRGMDDSVITRYLMRLVNGGYLEKCKEQDGNGHQKWVWTLVKDTGVETPKLTVDGQPSAAGRAKEQMWRSMKVIAEFNYLELAAAASTEERPVAAGTAKAYINSLHQVGYLVRIRRGKVGNPARYRTVPGRVRGPKPPMVLRSKAVFDQNTMQVVEPIR